jgi:hypothetical protein
MAAAFHGVGLFGPSGLKKGDYVKNGGAPGRVIRVGKEWADVRWYPGHKDGWSKRMPLSALEKLPDNIVIVYVPSGELEGAVYATKGRGNHVKGRCDRAGEGDAGGAS